MINARYSQIIYLWTHYKMVHKITALILNQFRAPLVCVQCERNPATYVNIILTT
jgi:hypothetical protein